MIANYIAGPDGTIIETGTSLLGDILGEIGQDILDGVEWLFNATVEVSYWVAAVYSVYNVCCYCVTHDKKYTQRIGITFIIYVFLLAIRAVLM